MRVDSHHHLWRYTPEEYGWIRDAPGDSMAALRRDFLPTDLEREVLAAGIDATVAVQARQTLDETFWLLSLAERSSLIRGVVGWAPIADDDFGETLETLSQFSLLKGLRHVVQAEPEGFLDSLTFNRGLAALLPTGLVYDLLLFARQLPEAIRLVDRHPNQTFVLDHLGKPDIGRGGFDDWSRNIRDLARRPNVACKLSGLVTEADWQTWSAQNLKPYFETALEAFGPSRLLFGSDWPVLTVACTYAQWSETVAAWLAPLSANERVAIEGETAARIYRLNEGSQ